MVFGLVAGVVLGFYDYFTKQAMSGNSVLQVVFWTSLFGAFSWVLAIIVFGFSGNPLVDISHLNVNSQLIIFAKSLAMTSSWLFAYYAVRNLPMSFSGAIRASGPLWTMAGGAIIFGEFLTPLQLLAVISSVLAYYLLAAIGKKEGIAIFKSLSLLMMLIATGLSSMATVFDKYIVQNLSLPIYEIQASSAIQRFLIASLLLFVVQFKRKSVAPFRWSLAIPLVGFSWVFAEWIYFFAVADPLANVTYLSIFRRMSLVVGFVLSALFFKEQNLRLKSLMIMLILLSTITLLFSH